MSEQSKTAAGFALNILNDKPIRPKSLIAQEVGIGLDWVKK